MASIRPNGGEGRPLGAVYETAAYADSFVSEARYRRQGPASLRLSLPDEKPLSLTRDSECSEIHGEQRDDNETEKRSSSARQYHVRAISPLREAKGQGAGEDHACLHSRENVLPLDRSARDFSFVLPRDSTTTTNDAKLSIREPTPRQKGKKGKGSRESPYI